MRRKGTARRGAVYMEAAMRVVVRSTSRLVGERGHVAGAREGAASGAAGPPAEDGTERSRFWTHQLVHPCVTPVVRTFHPCVTPVVRSGKDAMQCNGGRAGEVGQLERCTRLLLLHQQGAGWLPGLGKEGHTKLWRRSGAACAQGQRTAETPPSQPRCLLLPCR
jgi:hypothetical protein